MSNSPRREYREESPLYRWDGGPGYTCARCGEGGLGHQGHFMMGKNGWGFLCDPKFEPIELELNGVAK